MRPWPDSDIEVDQVWYPAAPGAAHLGRTSAYMSPDWDESDWCTLDAPGAVIDAPRAFNYRGQIVGLGGAGGHVCGTAADFLGQTLYNPDVEPVVYDDADIPACCDHVIAVQGGGEGDGTALFAGEVIPTPECFDAPLLQNGVTYSFTGVSGHVKWPPTRLVDNRFVVSISGAGYSDFFGYLSPLVPDCSFGTIVFDVIPPATGEFCIPHLGFFDELTPYVRVEDCPPDVTWTVRYEAGECPP